MGRRRAARADGGRLPTGRAPGRRTRGVGRRERYGGVEGVSTEVSGPDMAAIMAGSLIPRLAATSARRRCPRACLALVLETDLDLDPVLDDLAFLDDRPRLHDLDRLDVADGPRGGRDGLRAASLHERGLVPTISRMMMTPTAASPAADERPS